MLKKANREFRIKKNVYLKSSSSKSNCARGTKRLHTVFNYIYILVRNTSFFNGRPGNVSSEYPKWNMSNQHLHDKVVFW